MWVFLTCHRREAKNKKNQKKTKTLFGYCVTYQHIKQSIDGNVYFKSAPFYLAQYLEWQIHFRAHRKEKKETFY